MKNTLKQTPNVWEPALWAMLCGASSVSTTGTICDTSVTPEWFRAALILLTASIALGSGYKCYQSTKKIDQYIKNLKNRQK